MLPYGIFQGSTAPAKVSRAARKIPGKGLGSQRWMSFLWVGML